LTVLNNILKRTYRVYTSIDFCPVWNFFKALDDSRYILILKDYNKLPKYHPTKEFNELLVQYQEAMNDGHAFALNQLYRNTLDIRKKYFILSNSFTVLCYKKDENVLKIIRDLGYEFNPETWKESLISLGRNVQGLGKKLQLKTVELQSKLQKETKKVDIYQVLNNLEQYKGMKLDLMRLSVKEFCVISKAYEKWIKNQDDGRRKNRA